MNGSTILVALSSQAMLIIGVLMIGLVMVRLLLRPKRSGRTYESPLAQRNAKGHLLDAPELIGHWEVQMHDTARELMGELNTKIAITQQLVRDANAAAERIERALGHSAN